MYKKKVDFIIMEHGQRCFLDVLKGNYFQRNSNVRKKHKLLYKFTFVVQIEKQSFTISRSMNIMFLYSTLG